MLGNNSGKESNELWAGKLQKKRRVCRIPQLNLHSRKSLQSLREASFQVHGPKLFKKNYLEA